VCDAVDLQLEGSVLAASGSAGELACVLTCLLSNASCMHVSTDGYYYLPAYCCHNAQCVSISESAAVWKCASHYQAWLCLLSSCLCDAVQTCALARPAQDRDLAQKACATATLGLPVTTAKG